MIHKAREQAREKAGIEFDKLDINGDGDFEQQELRDFAARTWFNTD